ncbi:D-alanyl-D-alanine carboxypeptidase family protein [Aquariibacter albus]|uniref:serine-type D-Ala-D-Ala carboxypeptidase n=1 Tax=Aquariibacter albus TaxID=2759899 RepID=A0A839HHR6_9BURK|nr:D-alanyl-D-alanine carboxypeptidase family protein [Aquariibacter albus]MBB1162047.1 D-alanyl-D-alanine carboxypeptidase [Aquariibacter albus]
MTAPSPTPSLFRSAGRLLGALLLLGGLLAAPLARAQAPQPPEVAARSWLLLDVSTGQVLAAKDADTPTEPASLTKLMTAYLVFQALKDGKLKIDQTLPISERAWRTGMTGASRSFLPLNSQVRVDDLLKGMIVQSGNDATVALAEGVGGTLEGFIDMMNRQAAALGLKQTAFKNPEGLSAPGHQSTARELSVIASRLVLDFPDSLPYYSIKEYTYNGIKQGNRNLLLYRDPTVDGLKTGYTDKAGYCLIATAKRALPNGERRLLSVVLGADSMNSRANESQKLLNWGYAAFDAVKLFDANQAAATVPVWKGTAPTVKLGSTQAVRVNVPRGQGEKLVTKIERSDPLVAPLSAGQRVGTIKVSTPAGTPVAELPLVVLEPVPLSGLFGRAWDALRLWIQ